MRKNGSWVVALIAAASVMLASACAIELGTVTGSGNRVSRTFDVATFSEIDVSHAFRVRVDVDPSSDQSVVVEIDDNLVDRLEIRVENDRLRVGLDDSPRVRFSDPPAVEITVNELDWLAASGASNVSAQGVEAARFELDLSGASTVGLDGEVDELDAEVSGASTLRVDEIVDGDAKLDVSGASTVTLFGTSGLLVLDVSGASRVEADRLSAISAEVDASGASTVRVLVGETAYVDASGASEVVVAGDAVIDAETSGSSTVERG